MSLVLRLPREIHLCKSSSNVPRPPSFLKNATKPAHFAHFWQGGESPKRRFNVQKWREHVALCAFIDFEMCFAPQRRALFGHLNFQKWSEHEVLCTF